MAGQRDHTPRLPPTGRQTGRQRSVIVGYFEDGGNLVTMAMNGWGEGEPAWWLNLQANPDARVDLVEGPRRVRAHAATGSERVRLWDRWRQSDDTLAPYAPMRPSEPAGVVRDPRQAPPG